MFSSSDRNFANSVRDQTTWSRSSILRLCRAESCLASVLLPEPELPKMSTLMDRDPFCEQKHRADTNASDTTTVPWLLAPWTNQFAPPLPRRSRELSQKRIAPGPVPNRDSWV